MAGSDGHSPILSRRAALALGAGLAATGAGIAVTAGAGGGIVGLGSATPPEAVTGSFAFRQPDRAAIPVHYAIGAGDPRDATLVIVLHGVQRNAADYRDAWAELIRDRPVVAVAPEFSEARFPGSRGYAQGGVLDDDGDLVDSASWTFASIEPLFREMRARIDGRQTSFDVFGHSAGAQFAHRYVQLAAPPLLRRVVAANAGWYTMPDPALDYPYGTGGAVEGLIDWRASLGTNLTVLLGEEDVDDDDNLRHDDRADAQGSTRRERGRAYFAAARKRAAALGVPFAWERRQIPGVGHDYRQMSAAALDQLI